MDSRPGRERLLRLARRRDIVTAADAAHANIHSQELSRAGWTQVEVDTIDELRWWDLDALAGVEEEVFPAQLPQLVRVLLDGWDGVTRDVLAATAPRRTRPGEFRRNAARQP